MNTELHQLPQASSFHVIGRCLLCHTKSWALQTCYRTTVVFGNAWHPSIQRKGVLHEASSTSVWVQCQRRIQGSFSKGTMRFLHIWEHISTQTPQTHDTQYPPHLQIVSLKLLRLLTNSWLFIEWVHIYFFTSYSFILTLFLFPVSRV